MTTTTLTSPLKTLESSYKLPLVLLETGIKRVKYELLELHPEQECLINKIYSALFNLIIDLKSKKEWFVMLESVPKLKWTTLKDKSNFLDKDTLPTKWLQIAALGLTGREKDYLPYWNHRSKEISKKLLLPIETDCLESHSTCLNRSLTCMEQKSWFSTIHQNPHLNKNSFKTSCLSYMYTLVNKWENADTLQNIKQSKQKNVRAKAAKSTPNGTVKIRILPTLKQQTVFIRWLGGANYTYNHALYDIKHHQVSTKFNSLVVSHANDCDRYGNRKLPEFISFTPTEIRKSILNELSTAHQVAKTNRRLGHIKNYTIDYKRKKNQRQRFSFPIPSTSIRFYIDTKYPDEYRLDICKQKMKECMTNTLRKGKVSSSILEECRKLQEQQDVSEFYPSSIDIDDYKSLNTRIKRIDVLLKQSISSSKKNNTVSNVNTSIRVARLSRPGRNKTLDHLIDTDSVQYNCKLCYQYGYWYIHIPYVRQVYQEPKKEETIVALDPGFKTFQSYFSSDGRYGKYQHDVKRLHDICQLLDYYNWTLNNSWHAAKYVKLKMDRLYRKQLHLIEEMHQKVINDLTSQYNWILLPSFETQDMLVGKGYTKGMRNAKRHVYQLSHFKFKEHLKHRCQQMEQCKILIVSEAYTTKTCTCCGWEWKKMTTRDRVFKCENCKLEMDRDIHAARNILIRILTG